MHVTVTISGDRNVKMKEAENALIHKNLKTEIQRMWNVKIKVTPVIRGATGTAASSCRQYLSKITGEQGTNGSLRILHHLMQWVCSA